MRPLLENARRTKRDIEAIAVSCNYDRILLVGERPKIYALAVQLARTIEQLEGLGCYLKDLDIGIVDFLSSFEGRDIFLCWRLGEERISHWHDLDESCGNRQEIVDVAVLDYEL